ncbi:MAG TPA: sugar phosphate isomerase/epimerase [Solirubrobacterales bacterium]|nr:sugar phosphate isomerase/epimerase [Solirubrobacterales bacterium]
MPERPLEQVAGWAGEHGYEAVELAAWPSIGDRPFTAAHVAADRFDAAEADRVRGVLEQNGLELSALAYYDNNLHPDPAERAVVHEHLRACIDAAAGLGGVPVGTFIGRDPGATVSENLRAAEQAMPPLVDYAGERGVKLMIENCVMEGWHPDGAPGNLAYSPELWEWMFGLGLYLNFDPSHLLWLGIDPVAALRPHVGRVIHAHAKDAEVFPEQRNRFGFFGRVTNREQDPWEMGWWRYRLPGLGEVDFRRYLDVLYEGGFDGVLSVEHEDPIWGGTPELVERGLEIAQRNLRPLVVA